MQRYIGGYGRINPVVMDPRARFARHGRDTRDVGDIAARELKRRMKELRQTKAYIRSLEGYHPTLTAVGQPAPEWTHYPLYRARESLTA